MAVAAPARRPDHRSTTSAACCGCTRSTTIPEFALRELGARGRQPGGGGRRRPDRSRDQHPSLGRQRPLLPARQHARQHARVSAGHRHRHLALHARARRSDRPHARLQPGRSGSRYAPPVCSAIPAPSGSSTFGRPGRRPRVRSSSIARRYGRLCAATISGSARTRRCSRRAPTTFSARWTGSPPTSARPRPRSTASSRTAGFWPDLTADDLFYANKGRLYAYYLLMRAIEADFANVIRERELGGAWTQTLESFRAAATLQPWVIVNGAPDSQLMPSHLAVPGLLPAARAHAAQGNFQHPAQVIAAPVGLRRRPPWAIFRIRRRRPGPDRATAACGRARKES